jgi:hypothetical protein
MISVGILVSWLLVKGIQEVCWHHFNQFLSIHLVCQQKNHKTIQYSRVFAIIGYVWLIVLIKNTLCSDEFRAETLKKMLNNGQFKSTGTIDDNLFVQKTAILVGFIIITVIDFSLRFLVIDSLYHKYRDERKSNQMGQQLA